MFPANSNPSTRTGAPGRRAKQTGRPPLPSFSGYCHGTSNWRGPLVGSRGFSASNLARRAGPGDVHIAHRDPGRSADGRTDLITLVGPSDVQFVPVLLANEAKSPCDFGDGPKPRWFGSLNQTMLLTEQPIQAELPGSKSSRSQ